MSASGSVQAPSASKSDPRSRPRANAFAPEPPASGDPVPHVIMPDVWRHDIAINSVWALPGFGTAGGEDLRQRMGAAVCSAAPQDSVARLPTFRSSRGHQASASFSVLEPLRLRHVAGPYEAYSGAAASGTREIVPVL
jgi:hypothetical protein